MTDKKQKSGIVAILLFITLLGVFVDGGLAIVGMGSPQNCVLAKTCKNNPILYIQPDGSQTTNTTVAVLFSTGWGGNFTAQYAFYSFQYSIAILSNNAATQCSVYLRANTVGIPAQGATGPIGIRLTVGSMTAPTNNAGVVFNSFSIRSTNTSPLTVGTKYFIFIMGYVETGNLPGASCTIAAFINTASISVETVP